MTNTTHNTDPSESSSDGRINPSTAEGRSKLGLFAGLGALAIGNLSGSGVLVWGSILLITAAFVVNTAGKLKHYRQLPVSVTQRRRLSASWMLLAASVVGLLCTFAYSRYGPGSGQYFWPLAVAGFGFGLLHMAAQSKYLSGVETTTTS